MTTRKITDIQSVAITGIVVNPLTLQEMVLVVQGCCALWMLVASVLGATDPEDFAFSPVFGDYMVLQQSPAQAAVYGPAPTVATAITVTVSNGKTSYHVAAQVIHGDELITFF